ncbi:MAG: tRNA lysidine(34) synthetase TilS, partial [Trueperaceae bacterium]|nr:tRNA lysidine(34) synthetase TilS [Trueperaceae bacterium]
EAGAPVDLAHVDAARLRLGALAPWRAQMAHATWLRGAYGRVWVAGSERAEVPRVPATRVADAAGLPEGVDAAVLEGGALELRRRRPGDTIRLPGGTRSLADLLVDRKVPRGERDDLRVLAHGSQVLWVEGVAFAVGAGGAAGVIRSPEEVWMHRALTLAREAAAAGETPVGAIVVRDGRVLGEGRNRTEGERDPTAHAEVLALRAAARHESDWRLAGATLVVTLERCPMCFGALLQAHVGRVVYGARNAREGALGGVADLSSEAWKRDVEVEGGVLERECAALLRAFFAGRRASRAGDGGA